MKRTYQTSKDLPADLQEKTLKELTLGYLNLKDECFDEAKLNFDLALAYDPKCADAFWGQMLVKFQLDDEDKLYQEPVLYKSAIFLPECENALKFAETNQKKTFENILERIHKINEGDNY